MTDLLKQLEDKKKELKKDKYRIRTIKIINFNRNKIRYETKFDLKTKQLRIWLDTI